MEIKDANLAFHYAERLKSHLFVAVSTLDTLGALAGERIEGG